MWKKKKLQTPGRPQAKHVRWTLDPRPMRKQFLRIFILIAKCSNSIASSESIKVMFSFDDHFGQTNWDHSQYRISFHFCYQFHEDFSILPHSSSDTGIDSIRRRVINMLSAQKVGRFLLINFTMNAKLVALSVKVNDSGSKGWKIIRENGNCVIAYTHRSTHRNNNKLE